MSANQKTPIASFPPTERLCIVLSMNFAEGPHSHLSASCKADIAGGASKLTYPRHPGVNGVSVIDGDIDPDTVEIDLSKVDADVTGFTISAYPYIRMNTICGSLELYATVTCRFSDFLSLKSDGSEYKYSNTYKPTGDTFESIEWLEFVRSEIGFWDLYALAGSDASSK